MENWLMMVIAMTKTTMKIVSLTGMIVVEVASILIFAHNVPALVILPAMGIQILCQEMAFATMKQTPLNVLMMVWTAADPMLLLITALIVLVMVSKQPLCDANHFQKSAQSLLKYRTRAINHYNPWFVYFLPRTTDNQ